MFCRWTIHDSVIISISSIEISLKYMILLIQQNLLLDIHIEIDNGEGGLSTSRQIMWWLHFSNRQLPIHQVTISQQHQCMMFTFHKSDVIRCAQHREFLDWAKLLTQKLPKEGCVASSLKSSVEHFYSRHQKLVDRNEISIPQRAMDLFSFHVDFIFLLSPKRLLPAFIISATRRNIDSPSVSRGLRYFSTQES